MTLFGCNHLAHVIKVFGKCKNLCVKVQSLFCFIVNLRAFSKYKPPGTYICMGDLTEGFLRYEFGGGGGAYIWRGLYFRDFTVIYKNWPNYWHRLASTFSSHDASAHHISLPSSHRPPRLFFAGAGGSRG